MRLSIAAAAIAIMVGVASGSGEDAPRPDPVVVPLAIEEPGGAVVSLPGDELGPDGIAAEFDRLQQQIDELKSNARQARSKENATKSDDHAPTVKFNGQVQGDQVWFGQDELSRDAVGDLQDGAQFRRLRIGARGTTWHQLEYSLGVDFALANQPSYLDNYIEAHDLPWLQNVRFGHFFEPFSLERVTQNRNNTFMERSLVDTFAPARNTGVMAYGNAESERATWQIGTFRTNSDNVGNDSFDSGQALTMRATMLPWWDEPSDGEFYLHLGAAYSFRATSQNQVRFRNTPEIRKQQPASTFGPVGPPSPSNYINGQPAALADVSLRANVAAVTEANPGGIGEARKSQPPVALAGLAEDGRSAVVLVSTFDAAAGPREIAVSGLPWAATARIEALLVDDDHALEPVAAAVVAAGPTLTFTIDIPADATLLLRLTQP
jgi:hypothetical protein